MNVGVTGCRVADALVLAVVVILDLPHHGLQNVEKLAVGEAGERGRPLRLEPPAGVMNDGFEEFVLALEEVVGTGGRCHF